MGVLGALGTVAAIVCYPLVSLAIRSSVLYYGFCALALTVGMVCILAARAFELLVKYARQVEARLSRERGQGRSAPDAEPEPKE
jgi:hypothetical protein